MDQNTIALEPFVYKPIVVIILIRTTYLNSLHRFQNDWYYVVAPEKSTVTNILSSQHLTTVKHIEWRNSLDIRQTKETSCEHCSSLEQKIKSQKIMIGAVDQRNFVLQQKVEEQNKIIADLTTQIIELKENAAQFDEHLANETLELNDLREKNERIENAAQRFMIELGYDIEN